MKSSEFMHRAYSLVEKYVEEHLDPTDERPKYSIYTVWYCKTLQNHKALISTGLLDGMYYEVTYNGDKNEMYLDAYKKFENRCVKVEEEE